MSGAGIAVKVTKGIQKAGAKTGNGTPLTGTIIRSGEANTTTYPPTVGADAEYPCTLFLSSYSARDRQGTNITATDLKAMIAADIEAAPQNGDKLRVAGQKYSLDNVMPYKPGGVVLYFMATARSGG